MSTYPRQLWAALRVFLVFTVVCGVLYPALMTGFGALVFKSKANGSYVTFKGQTVGSGLIGQSFSDSKGNPLPQWFQPRPSATSPTPYNAGASAASNLGPSNKTLVREILQRKAQIIKFDSVPGHPVTAAMIPPDAVTASASGLDPDISPAYAYLQVYRVAAARGLSPAVVQALVTAHIQGRTWGFLGQPTVNVLALNMALAQLSG